MSYFADDAHWGALTGLTQGVVPQDPGQQGHGGLLLGAAQDVGPQVVDVHDCHRVDVYKRQASRRSWATSRSTLA